MHPRHNAGAPRLSIGKNNDDSPGTVSVYFIMLYVLGNGGDKKVTNLPSSDLRVGNARCVIAAVLSGEL